MFGQFGGEVKLIPGVVMPPFWSPSYGGALSVRSTAAITGRSDARIAVSSGHEVLPLGHGGRAAITVGLSINEMAFQIEMVGNRGMDRGKFL